MLVPNKNLPGHKEYAICFTFFAFGEGVTVIDGILNMNIYVADIVESDKDTIIRNLVNVGKTYL